MVYSNKVKPLVDPSETSAPFNVSPTPATTSGFAGIKTAAGAHSSAPGTGALNFGFDEASYLKLKPFISLDPTLVRLSRFLNCFGLFVCYDSSEEEKVKRKWALRSIHLKILVMVVVGILSGEVVYDVNLRQSKLLAEQKRSTPLLTFVIVAYSWLTLAIPVISNLSLIVIGSHLFRFYSRTTATVCNGEFFGMKTTVDKWYYYLALVLISFLDAMGQVVVLGVWPKAIDPLMQMILVQDNTPTKVGAPNLNFTHSRERMGAGLDATIYGIEESRNLAEPIVPPHVRADLIDFLLGEKHANGDLGICIKIACLVIQFFHSYAFLVIIVSLANHYANAINSINSNLDKYEFRRLLKQLIILRDSSEQISLMISIPFACITALVFMRQIALNGVFIQSSMQPFENWAVALQATMSSISVFMVYIYCDGLQSASKQTHRLKTEQTVVNENRGGNQSIYEFLDYLNRLSKSIRITFFNIIAINKNSLVGLYGHILTLTFVTS